MYITNLPAEAKPEMLEILFKQYPGYVQSKCFEDKHVAFIEFDTEEQAGVALNGLNGFRITPTHAINVIYAPK